MFGTVLYQPKQHVPAAKHLVVLASHSRYQLFACQASG